MTLGHDDDGAPITSLVMFPADTTTVNTEKVMLTKSQQTMFSILHAAKRLTTSEWNDKAKEVSIGVKRAADLYDMQQALKAKGLVTQLGDQWSVKHD
jgi:hypothetical protein